MTEVECRDKKSTSQISLRSALRFYANHNSYFCWHSSRFITNRDSPWICCQIDIKSRVTQLFLHISHFVFDVLTKYFRQITGQWASSWGFWSYVPYKASWCFDITCLLIKHPSNYAFISLRLLSICCHSMILLSFWAPHQSASSTIKKCPVLQPAFQKIPAFSAQSLRRRHP